MRMPILSPSVGRSTNAFFVTPSGLLDHQSVPCRATLSRPNLIRRVHFVASPFLPLGDLCWCYGLDSLDRCRLFLGSCWDCEHNISPC
jgi:hypothetical protein